MVFPLSEFVHQFPVRCGISFRLRIAEIKIFHPDPYVMECTFHAEFKAFHLAAFRSLAVYDQFQQTRCAVGVNAPVIQKT